MIRELNRRYMRAALRIMPWVGAVFVFAIALYAGLAVVESDGAALTKIFELGLPLLLLVVVVFLVLRSGRRSAGG